MNEVKEGAAPAPRRGPTTVFEEGAQVEIPIEESLWTGSTTMTVMEDALLRKRVHEDERRIVLETNGEAVCDWHRHSVLDCLIHTDGVVPAQARRAGPDRAVVPMLEPRVEADRVVWRISDGLQVVCTDLDRVYYKIEPESVYGSERVELSEGDAWTLARALASADEWIKRVHQRALHAVRELRIEQEGCRVNEVKEGSGPGRGRETVFAEGAVEEIPFAGRLRDAAITIRTLEHLLACEQSEEPEAALLLVTDGEPMVKHHRVCVRDWLVHTEGVVPPAAVWRRPDRAVVPLLDPLVQEHRVSWPIANRLQLVCDGLRRVYFEVEPDGSYGASRLELSQGEGWALVRALSSVEPWIQRVRKRALLGARALRLELMEVKAGE